MNYMTRKALNAKHGPCSGVTYETADGLAIDVCYHVSTKTRLHELWHYRHFDWDATLRPLEAKALNELDANIYSQHTTGHTPTFTALLSVIAMMVCEAHQLTYRRHLLTYCFQSIVLVAALRGISLTSRQRSFCWQQLKIGLSKSTAWDNMHIGADFRQNLHKREIPLDNIPRVC